MVVWSVKAQKPVRRGSTLRVTIPAEIVRALSLKPGERLAVSLMELEVGNKKVKAIVYYKSF
jgi:antitoxin component of MazEF toxin-antitoxin module